MVSNEFMEVSVVVKANLENSLVVKDENDNEVVIPKSQIHEDSYIHSDSDSGDEGMLRIPTWLAKDRGW